MKSFRIFLPLLAVLLLFGASAVFAETLDATRHVSNSGGNALWADSTAMPFMSPGDKITVVNDCGYIVTVSFLNADSDAIAGTFDVAIGATSSPVLIPFSQTDISLNTDKIAVCKKNNPTPTSYIKVYIGIGIPTLSEWAMIVFSVVLLGMMTFYVIRRRRTAQTVAV
jgi:hypothetical protein